MAAPEAAAPAPAPSASPKAKKTINDPIQEQLAAVFSKYCKFAPASTALDNVKWFKCVSELGLVDAKSLTRADVDLIFTKVKAKGERRINLQGFRDALAMVARKKAGLGEGEGDEVEQLTKMLAGKLTISPKAETKTTADGGAADGGSGAKKAGGKTKAAGKAKAGGKKKAGGKSIFDKLTDASQYTGSHKERFDKEGKGRGLAGRDSLSKGGVGAYHGGAVHDISQIMRPNLHQSPAKGANPNAAKATESTKAAPAKKKAGGAKKKKDGPSIFDKLTDASLYTGAHKQRFDSSGKGRGLDGRDSGGVERGGKVTDISQLVTRK